MKTCTSTVVLPCTPEAYWRVHLDPAYQRALYVDELHANAFEVLESGPDSCKLRIAPKVNLPGPVASLIGDSFVYEDHGSLNRAKNEWTWRMVPPSGGKPKKEFISTRGVVRIEAIGTDQCRRSDEVTLEGKIFGLGGIIEASAEKEVREAWEKEFALLKRWLQQPGA